MTSRWQYMVEDPLTGVVIAQHVPFVNVKLSESLNRPGSFTADLPLSDSHATTEIVYPGRRAIYAARDGRIQWGGVLWSANVDHGSTSIGVRADGWFGYWDHRDIWQSRVFTQTEQFEIVATLIGDAQDETGSGTAGHAHQGQVDLGITVEWDQPSGVLRDRTDVYLDHQSKNLGDALRELAAVENGFDYSMEYTLTGDTIGKTLRLHHPMRGRDLRGDLSHRFEFEFDTSPTSKTNIVDRGVTWDSSDQGWRVRGWGEGMDETRLRAQHVDSTAGAGFLPLDRSPSWSTVSEQATLNAHTTEDADRYSRPFRVPSITVHPDMHPQWGSYGLGDIVPVDIRDASPLASYEGPARITGWSIDTDNDLPTLDLEPVTT